MSLEQELHVEEILDYWFGHLKSEDDFPLAKSKLWFHKNESTDEEIRTRYEEMILRVSSYSTETFLVDERTALAGIVLFDQFSRNAFRGRRDAFETDKDALAISRLGLERGLDLKLKKIERAFFYMPLMHAEIKSVQKISIRQFKKLAQESSGSPFAPHAENFHHYANLHADVVNRFGRFPHRNRVLDRESTPEELAYMKTTPNF